MSAPPSDVKSAVKVASLPKQTAGAFTPFTIGLGTTSIHTESGTKGQSDACPETVYQPESSGCALVTCMPDWLLACVPSGPDQA